jgi:hypothetical protein
MRFIAVVIAVAILGAAASDVFAQQSTPKAKVAKDPKRCTYEACVQRGAKMGHSSSVAGEWCSKHNNGC